MNAIVRVFAVDIICPKCDDSICEPRTGSTYWSIDENISAEIRCPNCERLLKVKLPKDTK